MNIDILIPVAQSVLVVLAGYLGFRLTLHPIPEQPLILRRARLRYKFGFIILSVASVALTGWQAIRSQPHPSIWHRPISEKESKQFISVLNREHNPPHVRVGCTANDEAACVLASQLIVQFQSAGWAVDKLPAERMMLPNALLGITIFAHGSGIADPSNSRSGLWVLQTPYLKTLKDALIALGINAQVTADATMPDGVFGIYCGPDPGLNTPYYAD
jgi:hypothetical protein